MRGADEGEVGRRVKAAIKRSGVTQAEVARGLGISAPAFSRLLKQGRNLKLPQLQRIAALCGVKLEALVGASAAGPNEAWRVFRELVLLEMPVAVAYDLATGRGGQLSPLEREQLNGLGDRLRASFQAGEGPGELSGLFPGAAPPDR